MIFTSIFLSNLFTEGGTLMMSLILICFILSLILLAKGFMALKSSLNQSKKMLNLATDSSLLGLVIGFFASILGLISAFDTIESLGNPDPALFAAGLKVSLLTATFGLFSFIIVRLGILILRAMQKEENSND